MMNGRPARETKICSRLEEIDNKEGEEGTKQRTKTREKESELTKLLETDRKEIVLAC